MELLGWAVSHGLSFGKSCCFWEKQSLVMVRNEGLGGRICTFTSASAGGYCKEKCLPKGFHTGVGVKGVVPR